MGKQITAAVTTLALGLLALAPAAAQADSVSVSLGGGNTLQVVGDDADNALYWVPETDPSCPGGAPCYAVRSSGFCIRPTGESERCFPGSALIPSAPCVVSEETPSFGGHRVLCPASGVTGLVVFGGGGDDQFHGDVRLPADIRGGAGKDAITGTSANDTLIGGAGNDKLIAGLGDDLLLGQAGNDGLDGRRGRDRCIGGSGRDTPRHCERVRSIP
jgi:Ca2+-binding RTX toxin-like protein